MIYPVNHSNNVCYNIRKDMEDNNMSTKEERNAAYLAKLDASMAQAESLRQSSSISSTDKTKKFSFTVILAKVIHKCWNKTQS